VAVALALALMRLVDASGVFPYSELGINARVFGYGLGAAFVFGIVSGVVPAWKMARLDPVLALKGGAK
jgi:putative ABC transport system permease protein